MEERDKALLKAYADCNMVAAKAAKLVYLHPNSLKYRMDKIKRETGLDPRDFYDLHKLVDGVGT